MTPAEEALRDMWLAEMGAVVREYQPPVDPRALAVEKPVRRKRKAA